MGFTVSNLVLLKSYADHLGGEKPLGDLIMYGRLHSGLSKAEKATVQRRYKLSDTAMTERFTEPLIRELGAKSVTSIDISDYEGADIVFDLTLDAATTPELSTRLVEKFDTVLDYGTSEHVFNLAQTFTNAWNMMRDGGRYIYDLPITGWASHGLYQFSPNFFHSLQQTDYFEQEYLIFHPKKGVRYYDVHDFDKLTYWRLNGRKKISAWGVLKKKRPAGMTEPLRADRLRVVQSDVRLTDKGANRTYGLGNIAAAFPPPR